MVFLPGEDLLMIMEGEAGGPVGRCRNMITEGAAGNRCSLRCASSTGTLSGKPLESTHATSRWCSWLVARSANARQSVGGSSHAAGCFPGGADRKAVPRRCWSRPLLGWLVERRRFPPPDPSRCYLDPDPGKVAGESAQYESRYAPVRRRQLGECHADITVGIGLDIPSRTVANP